ncbi:hypothetical protein K474DRAFT_1670507 [Panus rudis PR-1116 ss-1]|nr:hypothetical protein K474DRAFT_1670507 [Panus rudis PR-1116 ss-1]
MIRLVFLMVILSLSLAAPAKPYYRGVIPTRTESDKIRLRQRRNWGIADWDPTTISHIHAFSGFQGIGDTRQYVDSLSDKNSEASASSASSVAESSNTPAVSSTGTPLAEPTAY